MKFTKEKEKEFMEAMTERLKDYEEAIESPDAVPYLYSCKICRVFIECKKNSYTMNCHICPLDTMHPSRTIGCMTDIRLKIKNDAWNTKKLLKARYEELIQHLDKM